MVEYLFTICLAARHVSDLQVHPHPDAENLSQIRQVAAAGRCEAPVWIIPQLIIQCPG